MEMRKKPLNNHCKVLKNEEKTSPIKDRTSKGSLMPFQRNLEFYLMAHLAVVLLCIESATGAAPPGGCTAVSANTGTGFGTTLPSKNNLQLSLSEPLPASASEDYLYIASYYDTGTEVRFYSQWGDLRYTNTVWQGGSGRFKSVILKDPLKLLVGDIGRTNNLYYSVTVSGLTYSVTLLTDYGHGEGYELAVSDPSSTLLFTKAEFFSGKCFLVKYLMGSTLTMPLYIWDCTQVDSFYMSMVYSNSYVFMGRAQGLMVYNKADLSLSLSCYRSDSCNSYGWLVDNLNLAIAFTTSLCPSSVNTIARLNLASQANYGNMAYQYLLTYEAYGSLTNNILNFGPYQYVVTMPLATTVINLLIYSKATLATKFSAALPLTTVAAYASNPTMRGFIVQGSRFYFAFIQNTGKKFPIILPHVRPQLRHKANQHLHPVRRHLLQRQYYCRQPLHHESPVPRRLRCRRSQQPGQALHSRLLHCLSGRLHGLHCRQRLVCLPRLRRPQPQLCLSHFPAGRLRRRPCQRSHSTMLHRQLPHVFPQQLRGLHRMRHRQRLLPQHHLESLHFQLLAAQPSRPQPRRWHTGIVQRRELSHVLGRLLEVHGLRHGGQLLAQLRHIDLRAQLLDRRRLRPEHYLGRHRGLRHR
jgi:hypothetical protein